MNADAFIRRAPSTNQGVFGMIRAGSFQAYSGELPARANKPMVSCVPPMPGEQALLFDVAWVFSPRFQRETYRLVEVPDRAGVLKHSANLMGDVVMGFIAQLNGCIALGERMGWIGGQRALLLSAPAIRRFETYMGRKPFRLEIAWT